MAIDYKDQTKIEVLGIDFGSSIMETIERKQREVAAQYSGMGQPPLPKPQSIPNGLARAMGDSFDTIQPLEMLAMRLRLGRGLAFPFKHISAHVGEQRAYVFIVNRNDEAVVLNDDPLMFPSDQLITQLRLLIG